MEPAQPSSPPSRKVERTRLRLVEAVRREVESTGRFTAALAARRAGSSPATFYNHFASKEDALLAAYAAMMDDLVAVVEQELRIEPLLDKGLPDFLGDWVLAVAGFFDRHSLAFRAAQTELGASKAMRDVYREHEHRAYDAYRRFVRLGQKARVLRAGDADALARVLMIQSEGWNHPSVIRMKQGDALHRELTRSVVRMLAPEEDA